MGTRLSTEAFPGRNHSGLEGTPAPHPTLHSSPSHPLTQESGTAGVCQNQNKRQQRCLRYRWRGFLGQSPFCPLGLLQVLLLWTEVEGFTLYATKILTNGLQESSYLRFQTEDEAPRAVLNRPGERESRFSGPIFPITCKYLPKKREFPMPGLVSRFPFRKLPKGPTSKLCGPVLHWWTRNISDALACFKGMPKNKHGPHSQNRFHEATPPLSAHQVSRWC